MFFNKAVGGFCACTMLLLLTPALLRADVAKKDLVATVDSDLRSVLNATGKAGTDQGIARINGIADRVSGTINGFQGDEIDDRLAKWIDASFVSLFKNRDEVLAQGGPAADGFVTTLVNQANIRFSHLDNAKGLEMLDLRDKLILQESPFWSAVQEDLLRKIKDAKAYDILVGLSVGNSLQTDITSFNRVVASLDPSEIPTLGGKDVDLRGARIASTLLTAALIYEVQEEVRDSESIDTRFGFGNITSKVFDDGDEMGVRHLKDFAACSHELDLLFNEEATTENGVMRINIDGFDALANDAATLRFAGHWSLDRKNELTSPYPSISFDNMKAVWGQALPAGVP
jgi:hypothetical protein